MDKAGDSNESHSGHSGGSNGIVMEIPVDEVDLRRNIGVNTHESGDPVDAIDNRSMLSKAKVVLNGSDGQFLAIVGQVRDHVPHDGNLIRLLLKVEDLLNLYPGNPGGFIDDVLHGVGILQRGVNASHSCMV